MASNPTQCTAPETDALVARYEERLRRTVRLRLDRQLSGIVDSSNVLD
jgi:hypothetical protein